MTESTQSLSLVELMAEGRGQASTVRKKYRIPLPLKTIRKKCLECVCGSAHEVKFCQLSNCPSWPYRFGRFSKEEDLRIPCFDRYGNFQGYRNYEGYPQEVENAEAVE